jgi:hypothetical protein
MEELPTGINWPFFLLGFTSQTLGVAGNITVDD